MQARLGVRDSIEPWARKIVRDYLPEQHRVFYPQLPFLVAAARDPAGRPWATLLAGPPGFIRAPDAHGLEIAADPFPGDALEASFAAGTELGLLGIELDTRRRNRANGTITGSGTAGIRFEVGQAFGNCPQYITERSWYEVEVDAAADAQRSRRLDAAMQSWIAAADTLFIASGYRGEGASDAFGMDASHRGGTAGFVTVVGDTRLVLPDYAGNNHFNTIGNLVMDPRVGLLFVDFEAGSLLQITGRAAIDFDSAEVVRYPGAQRLVVIDIDEVVRLDRVLPLRWTEPEGAIRSLRLARKTRESEDVVSLEFIARDGDALPGFEAGQHLPIEIEVVGKPGRVRRTYSLSNAPGAGHYRISVKREPGGLVSNLLHDMLDEGAIVGARAPAGDFRLVHSARPVVLISAGIGVTPMVSMLHALASDGRRVTFIHGARDGAHHPLAAEVRELAARHANVTKHISYSRPRKADVRGCDHDREGRITLAVLAQLVTDPDADCYVCGPTGFMADVADALDRIGVAAGRVHTETFGPAGPARESAA